MTKTPAIQGYVFYFNMSGHRLQVATNGILSSETFFSSFTPSSNTWYNAYLLADMNNVSLTISNEDNSVYIDSVSATSTTNIGLSVMRAFNGEGVDLSSE